MVPVAFILCVCFVATQQARQLQQVWLHVVCSNKEAQKRLAQRQSRNGPWTHEFCFEVDVFVCCEYMGCEMSIHVVFFFVCFAATQLAAPFTSGTHTGGV